jgi:hypothetical protein
MITKPTQHTNTAIKQAKSQLSELEYKIKTNKQVAATLTHAINSGVLDPLNQLHDVVTDYTEKCKIVSQENCNTDISSNADFKWKELSKKCKVLIHRFSTRQISQCINLIANQFSKSCSANKGGLIKGVLVCQDHNKEVSDSSKHLPANLGITIEKSNVKLKIISNSVALCINPKDYRTLLNSISQNQFNKICIRCINCPTQHWKSIITHLTEKPNIVSIILYNIYIDDIRIWNTAVMSTNTTTFIMRNCVCKDAQRQNWRDLFSLIYSKNVILRIFGLIGCNLNGSCVSFLKSISFTEALKILDLRRNGISIDYYKSISKYHFCKVLL